MKNYCHYYYCRNYYHYYYYYYYYYYYCCFYFFVLSCQIYSALYIYTIKVVSRLNKVNYFYLKRAKNKVKSVSLVNMNKLAVLCRFSHIHQRNQLKTFEIQKFSFLLSDTPSRKQNPIKHTSTTQNRPEECILHTVFMDIFAVSRV